MKRTLLAIAAGLVIGGATLGPLVASAADNGTLKARVDRLEDRLSDVSDRFLILCLYVQVDAESEDDHLNLRPPDCPTT